MSPRVEISIHDALHGVGEHLGFRMVAKPGSGHHAIHEARAHGVQARIHFLERQHEWRKNDLSELQAKVVALAIAGRRYLTQPIQKKSCYQDIPWRIRRIASLRPPDKEDL